MNARQRQVLVVQGTFSDIYEPALVRALNEIGVNARLFNPHSYTLPGILGRFERRVLVGPGVLSAKRALLDFVSAKKPDITLLQQGHYFDLETINKLKENTFVVGYHNDDPFGEKRNILRYRHLHRAFPAYDGYHFYRDVNVREAPSHGVVRTGLLMPYYIPWVDYPRRLDTADLTRWRSELVFAGHVEPDGRVDCLLAALDAGIRVRIFGQGRFWKKNLPRHVYRMLSPIHTAEGENYRKALCAAKIATAFYSKWNRDGFTRRSFEIPACGVMMLSERTHEMGDMFLEDREAVYFSCPEEFVDKARYYLNNDSARKRIADAGYAKVVSSGHDIHSRMRGWLRDVEEWIEDRG